MNQSDALTEVRAIRAEVVCLVGICGFGTHPLTKLIDAMEADADFVPEVVIAQAKAVRDRVPDFR